MTSTAPGTVIVIWAAVILGAVKSVGGIESVIGGIHTDTGKDSDLLDSSSYFFPFHMCGPVLMSKLGHLSCS